ncbi:hypothetical protein SASPL_155739 [Salvia splendens]|uniref:FAD-dependent oxidoreductase 2 FAD-binding domain-containing protein n=1 Tax=Salvia splendens TaxID=180675 RepID=A0A8X8VXU2_SALSN|nr:hypothetical protein SASPL_155739 [Salvia splendens]
MGIAEAGLKTACITKVFPTRSHTVAAQGGIAASLGNNTPDHWSWHMYDTVKGSDWLGDQDAIEYLCREAPQAVYELEHAGVPFSRNADGTIYQRPFGGHMQNMGEGPPVQRTCAAADRTGHAMLHALYQQSLKYDADFYVEYFALDLIMENGVCRGVIALCMEDGSIHRFRAHNVVLATGGYGRCYFSATSAHTCTGDGNAMVLRAGLPLQDMEFVAVPPDRHLRRGRADHRRRARRGRLSDQFRGRALHGALCPLGEGPGVARRRVLAERLPCITETGKIFAGVDLTRQALPVTPTVHYNMGGIPTNYHGEVVCLKDGNPDHVVPGLFAVGEAACVSVHGANRLGSNSLIDLVVFGRATGLRIKDQLKPGTPHNPLPKGSEELALSRLDRFRNANGATPTAKLRTEMQRTMQKHCAVFPRLGAADRGRGEDEGHLRRDAGRVGQGSLADLEHRHGRDAGARQSDGAGDGDDPGRREPQGIARRAHARGFPRA